MEYFSGVIFLENTSNPLARGRMKCLLCYARARACMRVYVVRIEHTKMHHVRCAFSKHTHALHKKTQSIIYAAFTLRPTRQARTAVQPVPAHCVCAFSQCAARTYAIQSRISKSPLERGRTHNFRTETSMKTARVQNAHERRRIQLLVAHASQTFRDFATSCFSCAWRVRTSAAIAIVSRRVWHLAFSTK